MSDEIDYKVIRNFIDPEIIYVAQNYFDIIKKRVELDSSYRNSVISTILDHGDVADSYTFYSDYLTEALSLMYGQKLCNEIGKSLSPTYTYARIYEKGNALIPHVDRPACEYSVTIPITISDDKASSIFISKRKVPQELVYYKPSIEEVKQFGEYERIDLMPGDALFYKGVEHFHWREPLESEYLIQFFMHYIDTHGAYAGELFDTRPYMGFPDTARRK